MSTALATMNDTAPANPIAAMLQSVVSSGMTTESSAVMKDLMVLYRQTEADNARRAFQAAFAALQGDLPIISATRIIPDNNGAARSKFAAIEDIMRAIRPHIKEHGFSVRFDAVCDTERITAVCILSHVAGHSENSQFSCRVSAPPKASAAQADGATLTYAKRMALCNTFNITTDKDTDARLEGQPITAEQAADLRQRVKATRSNEENFLAVAGADTFEGIMDSKLRVLDGMLKTKERKSGSVDHAVSLESTESVDPRREEAEQTYDAFLVDACDTANIAPNAFGERIQKWRAVASKDDFGFPTLAARKELMAHIQNKMGLFAPK